MYWATKKQPLWRNAESKSKTFTPKMTLWRCLSFWRQQFVFLWWWWWWGGGCFKQIVGIPMGTNCAPLLDDIFLYSYEAEFILPVFSTGRKQLVSRFDFRYKHIDAVLSINNPEVGITRFRCTLMNFRSKTSQRATRLFLTWIHFCWSGGTVNFTLPFMTNETISISISQIFRS